MSRQEWDSLPWWEAELYLEGLEAEMTGGQEIEPEPEAGAATGDRIIPFDRSLDNLASEGFGVRKVG